MFHRLADDVIHDAVVGLEQVIAAHAGLAGDAGGNHDDVGVRRVSIVLRAKNVGIPLLNGHGFQQIQTFALRHAVNDVDEHDIGEFFGGNPVSCCRAHVSRTDNRYFPTHESPFDYRRNPCHGEH
jgi:hypothetical protein